MRSDLSPRVPSFSICWLLLLAVAGVPAWGQGGPIFVTDELVVDSAAASRHFSPSAAHDPSGREAIFWEEDLDGIFVRFFDAAGAAQGEAKLVLPAAGLRAPFRGLTFLRHDPVALFNERGGFVLAWTEERVFVSSSAFFEERRVLEQDVVVQRFSRTGQPLSGRYRVHEEQRGLQSQPALAELPNGRLLVVWRSVNLEDPETGGIFGRELGANGRPRGATIRFDAGDTAVPGPPAVAVGDRGAVLVAWSACCDAGGDEGVFARVTNRALEPVGDVLRVNETEAHQQRRPAAVATRDGFLVAWEATTGVQQSRYGQRRVRAQVVGEDGGLLGAELTVSAGDGWAHDAPRLARAADGSVLVSWLVFLQDFPSGIASAVLDEHGERISDAAWVSTQVTIGPASVAALPDGRFLTTWRSVVDRQRAISARFSRLEP